MAILKLPSGLKASQLKHAAFLLGVPSAGKKSELGSAILGRLNAGALLPKPSKIVSIDMGIKNLGMCALEPSTSSVSSGSGSHNGCQTKLHVQAWKKVDVLGHLPNLTQAAFGPSSLSKVAVSIAKDLILTYKPTHILIERQRFRSGGAAAVQEWTLRVNMLESMLWASLETLRGEMKARDTPNVHEVSPARVAKFWCQSSSTAVTEKLFENDWQNGKDAVVIAKDSRKVEKKDKIAVVSSWLANANGRSSVQLEFYDEALRVAESFISGTSEGRGKKSSKEPLGKLDDLADCLLQGAAWVRWEENRQQMLEILG